MTEEPDTLYEPKIAAPPPVVHALGIARAVQFGTVWMHRAPALKEPHQAQRSAMEPKQRRRSRVAMGRREGRRARAVGRALGRFLESRDGLALRMGLLANRAR